MYGITWNLTEIHGWGLVGVHTALTLLEQGRPPLLFDKPLLTTMRPHVRAKIEPLMAVYERYATMLKDNPGAVFDFTDVDMLHSLMNGIEVNAVNLRGRKNIGVIAFEDSLIDAKARERGRNYDFIVAHSLYNRDLLTEAGFPDVRMVWQGVDPDEVALPPRTNRFGDRFVVFSGGKLEFRKAQDVVLEGFRRFHARHPDSVLVTAWHNPWPGTALSMAESRLAKVAPTLDGHRLAITAWAIANGLPEAAFVDLGFLMRAQITEALAEVDAAVFPNRCEGATNLVAMECMGGGIPCLIAANSGQRDLMIEEGSCFPLARQTPLANPTGSRSGWCDSDPDEVAEGLEQLYTDRAAAKRMGERGRAFILGQRTWRHFAEHFVAECDR